MSLLLKNSPGTTLNGTIGKNVSRNMPSFKKCRLMASIVSDKSDKKVSLLQEVGCNTMITLINQETYLLKRQILRLAKDFEEQGGFTERLYRVRKAIRTQQPDLSDLSDKSGFSLSKLNTTSCKKQQ